MEYEDRLTITTPEGVDLRLTLAGVGSRFVSALVDGVIQWAAIGALAVLLFGTDAFGAGGSVADAAFAVGFFALFWGYDVAFEVLASGRTPGKRWNGLRVVRVGGQPVGFLTSAIRNLLRIVDWLPSFYLVGIAAVLATGKNQRIGDVVAGTIVVREHRGAGDALGSLAWGGAFAAAPAAEAWDTSAVTPAELAAVRSFLERRYGIDDVARRELATTLETRLRPKVSGVADEIRGERFLEQLAAVKAARG